MAATIRQRTKRVVRVWASVPTISDDQVELCVLWTAGHEGTSCDDGLPALVTGVRDEFPNRDLSDLRPSDMKGSGKAKTVDALVGFVAGSTFNKS